MRNAFMAFIDVICASPGIIPCREKEHRRRMWSDSRAGHRLAKDRGHRVCTCVPIALYTAE